MHWVSLFIELLRTRPVAVFWAAALAQAALWTLVPALVYSAPPGDLAEFLAVAHETGLGNPYGPPLAYWLAETAFRVGGIFGVYLLSQICVLIMLWAMFSLGRIIVGAPQAAIAVLLTAGIAVFAVPTPEFNTALPAMALWSLILLHYWRAVGQGRRLYWIAVGFEAGLLLLTTYSGFVLIVLLHAFALATRRGREQFTWPEPYIGGVVLMLVVFRYLIYVEQTNALGSVTFEGLSEIADNTWMWLGLLGWLVLAHAGLLLLVLLGRGFSQPARAMAPAVDRAPLDPDARTFVWFFALAPAAAIGIVGLFSGRTENFVAPALVVLSALAVIVMASDRLRIVHQRAAQHAWAALLLAPPLVVALGVPLLPWLFPVELRVALPAVEMARFFAENFERRTGRPLSIVTGDTHTAALVALMAPSRPSLYSIGTPELTPWVTRRDIEAKGAVVVWPTATTAGLPPPPVAQGLPGLVPEVPRAFARRFQGRLPLIRMGWSMIRPAVR